MILLLVGGGMIDCTNYKCVLLFSRISGGGSSSRFM
jgi:hypothetical protein